MTIEEQVNFIAQQIGIARTALIGLQSRNAHTPQDEARVTGLETVHKTLSWCRDNRALIVKLKGGGNG